MIVLPHIEDLDDYTHCSVIKTYCKKRKYVAKDADILVHHMKKHTDGILHSCYKCECEATRESLLENHNEREHMKSKFAGQECGSMSIMLVELIAHVRGIHAEIVSNHSGMLLSHAPSLVMDLKHRESSKHILN